MKTKIKRHSRSVISAILAVCMLISCMTVGLIATDAAYDNSERVGTKVTLSSGTTVYLDVSSMSWFHDGNAIVDMALANGDSGTKWYSMDLADGETDVYKATLVEDVNCANVIFVRRGTHAQNWTTIWNQSIDVDISSYSSSNNCWTISGQNSESKFTGSWTTYDPATPLTTPSVSDVTATASETTPVTLTVSNHAEISSEDAGVTYRLYTDAECTTEASGYSSSENTITIPAKYSNGRTYYVKAIASGAVTSKSDSEPSSVTVTINKVALTYTPTATLSRTTPEGTTYNNPTSANSFDTVKLTIGNLNNTVDSTGKTAAQLFDFSLTGATGTYSDGALTATGLTGNTTTGGGKDYSLQATATLKSSLSDYYTYTATSSAANAVTVYTPIYSLHGNVSSDYLAYVNGAASTASSGWGTTPGYQEAVAVKNPTETPGKYSITITTLQDSEFASAGHHTINIGLYQKDGDQIGFRTGTDPYYYYNELKDNCDLSVAEYLESDVNDTLVAQTMTEGKTWGGSLIIEAGKTYTIYIDQTTGANNGSPNGKITFDLNQATVRAKARVQTFNATSGVYNGVMAADDTQGTVTVTPETSTTPFSSTLTAAAKTGYSFVGWYTDINCTEAAFEGSKETSQTISAVNNNQLYYALFKQNEPAKHTITLSVGANGSVAVQSGATLKAGETNKYEAYDGARVTFKATPASGYVLLPPTGSPVAASVSGNNITLANVNADTTLTVAFKGEVKFMLYKNPTAVGGTFTVTKTGTTVTASDNVYTVDKGDTVTLTAPTASGYTFKKWIFKYLDGTTSEDETTNPCTFTADKNFKAYACYTINATDSSYQFKYWGDGSDHWVSLKYYAGSKYDSQTNLYKGTFTPTSGTTYSGLFFKNDDSGSAKERIGNGEDMLSNWRWFSNNEGHSNNDTFKPSSTGTHTVLMYVSDANKVVGRIFEGDIDLGGSDTTISDKDTTSVPSGYHTIYAKNGTIGADDGGTSKWGKTVVTGGNALYKDGAGFIRCNNSDVNYTTYYYNDSSNSYFTVQTTMSAARRAGGWGVAGFVVNGETYTAEGGEGVYTAQVKVPKNTGDIEVTPVYYNVTQLNKPKAQNPYIKFYVDASSLGDHWGNTVAYYSWYDNGTTNGIPETGTYPGQPMLKDGSGKLYTYISKKLINEDGSLSNYPLMGVLLDNLSENDAVHQKFLTADQKKNFQTYDYLDPVLIAQQPGLDTMQFTVKYKANTDIDWSTVTDSDSHQSEWIYKESSCAVHYMNDILDSSKWDRDWSVETGKTMEDVSNFKDWEYLTDYDGNYVNILNTKLTDAQKGNDPLYVVSVGNIHWQPDSATGVQKIGQWATVWNVYDKNGNLITCAPPSYFLDPNTDAYKAINATGQTYAERPIKISYEKEEKIVKDKNFNDNNTGIRVDGRWLYSSSNDETRALIKVVTEGTGASAGTYALCPEGGTADIGGGYQTEALAQAASDDSTGSYYGTDVWFNNRTTEATMRINVGSGYQFLGFRYLKAGVSFEGDGLGSGFSASTADYTNINGEGTAVDMTIDTMYRIVAVVKKLDAQQLNITHHKYGASLGRGFYYVSSQVVEANGTVVAGSEMGYQTDNEGETTDEVLYNNFSQYYVADRSRKLLITLTTEPYGTNTFIRWLKNNNGAYEDVPESAAFKGSNETCSVTLEIPFTELFDGTSKQLIQSINYYSDLDLAGNVTVSHNWLTDSKIKSGRATTKVEILDGESVIRTYNETDSSINVGADYIRYRNENSYQMRITIKTYPDAGAKFENFYWTDARSDVVVNGTVKGGTDFESVSVAKESDIDTAIFVVDINDFFTEPDPTTGEINFNPAKNRINFYSSLEYLLQYRIMYDFRTYRDLYGKMTYGTDKLNFTADELEYMTTGAAYDEDEHTIASTLKFNNLAAVASLVKKNAPYEDGFQENVTWITDKISDVGHTKDNIVDTTGVTQANDGLVVKYNSENTVVTIIVQATQSEALRVYATFKLPYRSDNTTGGMSKALVPDTVEREIAGKTETVVLEKELKTYGGAGLDASRFVYGSVLKKGDKYYTAPDRIYDEANDKFKYFSYWEVANVPTDDSQVGKVYTKCYSKAFNLALYQDSVITAVFNNDAPVSPYAEAVKGNDHNKATISFMENSRSQWTSTHSETKNAYKNDNWKKGDRVYTDFLLSFAYDDMQLNTGSTKEFGVVIETVGDLSDMDDWATKQSALKYTQTQYAEKFPVPTTETYTNSLKDFIRSADKKSGNFLKGEDSVTKLDNKNRIDYYYAFPLINQNASKPETYGQPTGREEKVYRAYSYLKDGNNILLISDPMYFTIYDIANMDYQTAHPSN